MQSIIKIISDFFLSDDINQYVLTNQLNFVSGSTDSSSLKENSEVQNITILDARKHNPGPFSQAGFTLIKLDEV